MAAAVALKALGTATSVLGQYREGKEAKAEGRREARQLRTNAKQEKAYSQRRAIEEKRQAELVKSRATAVAAATGGMDDTSVTNILNDIASEGEYRAMLQLYEGDEASRSLNDQADAAARKGNRAYKAARMSMRATALDSSSSMFGNYGGGGG